MIHVAIIGGGNISETHARAIQHTEGAQIAAVYGQNHEKAARLAQLYGGRAYERLGALLKHRPLDMVVIGSPSGLHAEQGMAAAQHGLHVLVEKPIDINLARADALISECERAGVKLGVFFQDRVAPGIRTLKELIEMGRLGKLHLVSARVKWYRPPEYYSGSRWRGTHALDGGGALINQGVHTLDLLLWLLGDVERVYAKTLTALHRIEAEDTVVATLEFTSGVVGTLEAATSVYPGYPRRLELTGSEGTIILENDRIVSADLRESLDEITLPAKEPDNANVTSPVVSDFCGHQCLLEDFISAIKTSARPICNGYEGRRSLELALAIYESSHLSQPVSLVRRVADADY